jgi:NAD(P)-dependent dehydrogenase (short-subunit alcohol dehydrogenase family)
MEQLAGRVAVVTGAASGIGRAVAAGCAAAGMRVVLADVEADALDRAVTELAATGAQVAGVATDVADAAAVDRLAAAALDRFGAVHLVHNNAGVGLAGLSWQCTLADWQWVIGVNLWGVVHGLRTFVPLMLERGDEGHIVNTASMAGLTSPPYLGPYNASKHGVVAISETLARELAMEHSRIGVSVLCPGFVHTAIGNAARNRPAALRNRPGEGAVVGTSGIGQQLIDSGLSPEAVAEQVLYAVRTNRFYILTHPEMAGAVRSRMTGILEGRTPRVDDLFG